MGIRKQHILSLFNIGLPAALFFFFDFLMRLLFPVQSAETLEALPLALALLFFFLPTVAWGIHQPFYAPQKTYAACLITSLAVAGLIFFFSFLRLLPPVETFWEDLLTVFLFMFLVQVASANVGLILGKQIQKRFTPPKSSFSHSSSEAKSAA